MKFTEIELVYAQRGLFPGHLPDAAFLNIFLNTLLNIQHKIC